MAKLNAALAAVKEKLGLNQSVLQRARRRSRRFHGLATSEHERQLLAEKKGRPAKAERFKRRAEQRHKKAVYWRGKIKQEIARINHLEKSEKEAEAQIAKWHKEHGVYMESPNKVRGGQIDQR